MTRQCLGFAAPAWEPAHSPACLFPAGPLRNTSPPAYGKEKRLVTTFFFFQTTTERPESRQSSLQPCQPLFNCINLPEMQPLGASRSAPKNIHGAGTGFSPFPYFAAYSLLSCLKTLSSFLHPSLQSSSLCEYPHQSPTVDLTSVISTISPATEQIVGSYQPIKEPKNAVTSFLSAKRTQSPADYSINLLMNLSCQTDSQRLCKVGVGNFNLPRGSGPGLTRFFSSKLL